MLNTHRTTLPDSEFGGISMSERGTQLLDTADRQISELTGLIATPGETALRLPCPGREKLGDGTVAACALHTADNYHRIARFLNDAHNLRAASSRSPIRSAPVSPSVRPGRSP
jgi:hypothetical protein